MKYIYRWNRLGRKGHPCELTARSTISHPSSSAPALAFGAYQTKHFNSVRVVYADGFTLITSGNAIRKAS